MKGEIQPVFQSISHYIDCLRRVNLNYKNDLNEAASSPKVSLCKGKAPKEKSTVAVSIISSFYNVPENYFIETNRSIKNQTFQNYEWIVVDDCSTDADAISLFKSLPELNDKIRTIQRQQNGGLAAGRNTAIQAARGEYLFFMDTDDLLDPTMIEKCVIFLEIHAEFSFVNTYSVGFQAQEYWWDKGFDKPSEFINENRVTGRLLYRKKDFEAVGGFDETLRFYEDWERWLRAIAHAQKGWTIPEYLDCYRRTNSGLLATSRSKVEEEKQVTNLIRSRYQVFFKTHTLPDICIERPMFDATTLHHRIKVCNPVNAKIQGKRILCWFPHLEVGGADKFNLDLLISLRKNGYKITILTTLMAQNRWFEEFYEVTPDIFQLPNLADYGHWASIVRYLMESRHIDLCFISNAYYAYHLLPIIRPEFPDVAFIDYTHTVDPGWRQGGYPRVSCQFTEFLDRQIVSSNHLANEFIQLNPKTSSSLKVCYINVDEKKWKHSVAKRTRLRQELCIPDDSIVLLFPARMTVQKRPIFFVDIIKSLVDEGLPITALMLGSGDLDTSVNQRIAQYSLEKHIYRLPFKTSDDMLSYYSAADILLLPSAYEGISLVLYESMAMGLSVVASNVGGQRELVIPGTGFLLPLGDADEIECGNYLDVLRPLINSEQTRQKVGNAARQRIESCFSLEKMVDRMEALFREGIEHRKRTKVDMVSRAINEEMVLWVQEFLALDHSWQDSQRLAREYEKLQEWAQSLEKERNLYQIQSEAWQRVAQQAQIKLNKLSSSVSA